jgi:hypothetical protein
MKDLSEIEFIAHLINLKKSRLSNTDSHWVNLPDTVQAALLAEARKTLDNWKKGESEAWDNLQKLKGQSDTLN